MQPVPATVAAIIQLPPATLCAALRAACATTQPDALAEAIDDFLETVGETPHDSAVYRVTGPVIGMFSVAEHLDDTRAAADREADLSVDVEPGTEPDEEDARLWDAWDRASHSTEKHRTAEWRGTMAAMLAGVEAALLLPPVAAPAALLQVAA